MARNVAALAVILVLAYLAGRLLSRFKHARYTRAWRELIPLIGGTVHEDPQGGGATSWLTGTYGGRTIHARMSPDVRSTNEMLLANRFGVGVVQLAGASSWRVVNESGLPGLATPKWRARSDDRALEERLATVGIADAVGALEVDSVAFDRHAASLFVDLEVQPLWAPPPDRFVQLLDAVVALAKVNDEVNVKTRS